MSVDCDVLIKIHLIGEISTESVGIHELDITFKIFHFLKGLNKTRILNNLKELCARTNDPIMSPAS